ncbi:hypothetical protein [uncultured Anaerovibrio sp.]|uniref:hypothetical protein n=1 Tax=uncultured Anaerovibrio sp. TaxID=361586 RepID=UPI00262EE9C0|nr:hypothetical protein [uncultured Anaerovibrio sp.]
MPREDDIFQERLYAVKYVNVNKRGKTKDGLRKKPGPVTDATFGESYFREPNESDLKRENIVYDYVAKNFDKWQKKGYIPSDEIIGGDKTDELTRTRGWRYWHQLFNCRQLLFAGLANQYVLSLAKNKRELVIGQLCVHKILDYNSKLCAWVVNREYTGNTFYNQALNTMFNYGVRSSFSLASIYFIPITNNINIITSHVDISEASQVSINSDIWITDPPYADAVNYHELTEFFLAWDKSLIKKAFPDWYTDSKRSLAIKGTGKDFNNAMVSAYKNLANNMPDNGLQIVMFTHQDTRVWAELSMILWSAGLQVTAAWCIATETESGGLKQGNYVKGTVLMVLKKRLSEEVAFEDELYEEIRDEVQLQIDSMSNLDDLSEPDFNDGDYLLAAYVAALKVLTSYANIEGLDVQYELEKARDSREDSPVTKIINTARKEAYDYLVPEGIQSLLWSKLTVEERFYIKALAMEMKGVHQMSAFQELARGFGVAEYTSMLGSTRANQVRLKLPMEYKMAQMGDSGFGSSMVRNILAAIYLSEDKDDVREGCSYLRSHYQDNNEYWDLRSSIISILDFLSKVSGNANVDYWQDTAKYVSMLKEAIRNDGM